MNEKWLPVIGYEGLYEVSTLGRVKSVERVVQKSNGPMAVHERIRIAIPHKTSRAMQVVLSVHGHRRTHKVHILVAAAFIGPRPPRHEVCHGDGNPQNNALSNLRYDTKAANEADKVGHGTTNRGQRHGLSKLTEDEVREVFRLSAAGTLQRVIADRFGVKPGAISRILSGARWGHLHG